jgi:3-hydroxyacyl-CoA dehydrogenase
MGHPLSKASVVGVIGAGAMGAGIAQVAAMSGHPVVLFDIDPVAVDKALSGIAASLAKLGRRHPERPRCYCLDRVETRGVDYRSGCRAA